MTDQPVKPSIRPCLHLSRGLQACGTSSYDGCLLAAALAGSCRRLLFQAISLTALLESLQSQISGFGTADSWQVLQTL